MAKDPHDAENSEDRRLKQAHPDAITGEPGSHPIGAALGAAGAGAAGAAIGAMAGPLGAIAGAVIGGLTGGMAGREMAETISPTNPLAEHEYWYANYRNRPYVRPEDDYDLYRPAYQQGMEAAEQHADKSFEEIEPELREKWETHELKTSLEWERAREAARDSWQRVDEQRRAHDLRAGEGE